MVAAAPFANNKQRRTSRTPLESFLRNEIIRDVVSSVNDTKELPELRGPLVLNKRGPHDHRPLVREEEQQQRPLILGGPAQQQQQRQTRSFSSASSALQNITEETMGAKNETKSCGEFSKKLDCVALQESCNSECEKYPPNSTT